MYRRDGSTKDVDALKEEWTLLGIEDGEALVRSQTN
jgi:hypothetical protein